MDSYSDQKVRTEMPRDTPTKACKTFSAGPFWPLWSNGSVKGFSNQQVVLMCFDIFGNHLEHDVTLFWRGTRVKVRTRKLLQNANLSHPNVVLNKPLQLDCARKLSGLQWFAILVFALSTRTFHVRRLWYRTLHPSCSTAAPAACKRDLFATAYRLRSGDHRATSLF